MILSGFPVRVMLKDGGKAIIRPMGVSDAEAVQKFFRELPEEDRMFLNDDVTSDTWIEWFMSQIDYKALVPLIAEMDGEVVGHVMLQRTLHGWMTHVGQVRVVVARRLQNKGLGAALLRQAVRIAINSGLEKLVARVVEDQIGARKAFEKLGFRAEAVLRGHVHDIRGRRRNLIVLSNDVSYLWESMESLLMDRQPV